MSPRKDDDDFSDSEQLFQEEFLRDSAPEQVLDSFLEETASLRRSAESTLAELSRWEKPFPQNATIGEKLGLLRETLEQFSHSLSTKFELTNSFVRDGAEVIDGRLALTTRVLSERFDEVTVALAQIADEVSEINLKELPPATDTSRLEQSVAELLRTIDTGNLNINRRQQELEARLARIEAVLTRPPVEEKKPRSTLPAWIALALVCISGAALAWLHFPH